MKKLAVNPYLPGWEYIPDGEPHLFDGRIYIYGSHDAPGGTAYCPGNYVCWSAPVSDLGDWRYEGVIYRRSDDPVNFAGSAFLFAPDVCKGPDGRYYLYYVMNTFNAIGVAVCSTPAGHYRFLGNVHLPNGNELTKSSGYGMLLDPAVYVEDNTVYLYYGFGISHDKQSHCEAGAYVAKLSSDLCTLAEIPHCIVPGPQTAKGTSYEEHPFFEASSMRKLNGRYYFIYSSIQGHELCYGLADAPDAPPRFGGVIVSNGDIGLPGHESEDKAVNYMGNNHGSLVQIREQVYIFYHRHTHGKQYSRQGCAEPVKILPDGRIPQVEITSCGLNGGPLPAIGEYSAHIACALHGTAGTKRFSSKVASNDEDAAITQESDAAATSSSLYIANLKEGSGCGFKYFIFTEKSRILRLELRGSFQGTVAMHLDEEDGPVAAIATIEPSEHWRGVETFLSVFPGIHAVYLTFKGDGACDLNAIAFE